MRNLDKIKGRDLLEIDRAEELFSSSSLEAKHEYRSLAAIWHPDRCKDSSGPLVFQRLVELYKEALEKIESGTWDEPYQKVEEQEKGVKKFICKEGKELKSVEYISTRKFELGRAYIGNNSVTYQIGKEFDDLFNNARKHIRQLVFKDEEMAIEMSKCLPQIMDIFQSKSSLFITLRKTPDQLLLADILAHLSNRIEPIEHLGWILNVVLNISCYLEWSGLTHNAISPETVFISPLRHSGALLGGWWYAREAGALLEALPDRSIQYIPPYILDEKRADHQIDLELIKALGRELLSDAPGHRLRDDGTLPEAIRHWLLRAPQAHARDEYRSWKYEVLEDCFGAPSFVAMNLDSIKLYKEK